MSLGPDSDDDRLSDLPPVPPLDRQEEALGPEGDIPADGIDGEGGDGDERVGLDTSHGLPEGLEAHELVDDLGDEASWVADDEANAASLPLDSLVDTDAQEYGHTEGTEADDEMEEGLWEDVSESAPPPAMDDGGDEGVDELEADWKGGGDDDAVSLPPLDADEPEGLDDPTDDTLELPDSGGSQAAA